MVVDVRQEFHALGARAVLEDDADVTADDHNGKHTVYGWYKYDSEGSYRQNGNYGTNYTFSQAPAPQQGVLTVTKGTTDSGGNTGGIDMQTQAGRIDLTQEAADFTVAGAETVPVAMQVEDDETTSVLGTTTTSSDTSDATVSVAG